MTCRESNGGVGGRSGGEGEVRWGGWVGGGDWGWGGGGAGIYYVGPLSNCSIKNIGLNK